MALVFSCEICKIFNNNFFIEHLRRTASFHCRAIEAYLVGPYQTSLMQLFAKLFSQKAS